MVFTMGRRDVPRDPMVSANRDRGAAWVELPEAHIEGGAVGG
jgi:hypothetical protein